MTKKRYADRDVRNILLISGLFMIGYNLYWLTEFNLTWNILTYQSWMMLAVGFLFTYPSIKGNKHGDIKNTVIFYSFVIIVLMAAFIYVMVRENIHS